MNKIPMKEYISWSLTILFGVIAIIQGSINSQLQNKQKIIQTSVQNIHHFIVNNNYNLPPAVQAEIKNIAKESGVDYVTLDGQRATLDGEPVVIK
jgi:hypothetical protein